MNILIVNWSWYPSGGDWTYVDNLIKFYESKGHNIIPFSMENEKNFPSPYSKYFVSHIDYKKLVKEKSLINGAKAVQISIYSKEAKQKIKLLLDEFKIDVVHINNIHHYLTPSSIIPQIKKKNIPIIWTLHDYVILCPNTTFVSHDKICEKCKGGRYYNCVIRTCKKGSRGASLVAALENYVNDYLNPYQHVNYFICPSKFIASKFIEYGYSYEKIIQIYNLYDFAALDTTVSPFYSNEKYILYVGNILQVKGVLTLINAVKDLNVKLYIIGDGEDYFNYLKIKENNGLDNIHFLGKKNKEDVIQYIKSSILVVVPSEWYENLPYSLMEALLLSKVVLASNIGGIPEMIIDGETGFLFEPGNLKDLKRKLQLILEMDSDKLVQIGIKAGEFVKKIVSFENFDQQILPLFNSLNLKLQ